MMNPSSILAETRATLARLAARVSPGDTAFYGLVQRALGVPVTERYAPCNVTDASGQWRLAYTNFLEASALRLGAGSPQIINQDANRILMLQRIKNPAEALWYAWQLYLAEQNGHGPDGNQIEGLWTRTFAQQNADGHLYQLTEEGCLDSFVYDELVALHAAANLAFALRDERKISAVRRMVDYHVRNTQPDNTTNQPWALAAFAVLDGTGFAQQQLHDARNHLNHQPDALLAKNPLALALLADAVLTLDAYATK